jgi:hypothetical protein
MTRLHFRQLEEQFSPLEQRVIAAVQRDAAVPPKPYEEMTLEEGLAWIRTLEPRHLDPGVEVTRTVALNVLLGLVTDPEMTNDGLAALLDEVGTHEGRCAFVARYPSEARRLGLL